MKNRMRAVLSHVARAGGGSADISSKVSKGHASPEGWYRGNLGGAVVTVMF